MTEDFQRAVADIQEKADLAIRKGRFQFVIYYLDADPTTGRASIEMHRTTHDFPTGDLEESVRMLERDVRQELERYSPPPMETAQPKPPTINLFGGEPPAAPPPVEQAREKGDEKPAATQTIEVDPENADSQ